MCEFLLGVETKNNKDKTRMTIEQMFSNLQKLAEKSPAPVPNKLKKQI